MLNQLTVSETGEDQLSFFHLALKDLFYHIDHVGIFLSRASKIRVKSVIQNYRFFLST